MKYLVYLFQLFAGFAALTSSPSYAFRASPPLALGLRTDRLPKLTTNKGLRQRKLLSSVAADSNSNNKGFLGRLQSALPPAKERKKLFPLGLMFFCILFNYTVLRDTKDVLLVTAPKSGAEVIPFIKTYCNLPTAIGMAAGYAYLCDHMEQKNVFYACVIPFLVFFASFALLIYPNNAVLHPHAWVDHVAAVLPAGFSAPLAIVRNWSFALFYVLAEMWGSVVTSLLFWGFANQVTTVEEAKKYCMYSVCVCLFACL
jgi:AAA family ATP:ADP antiporter